MKLIHARFDSSCSMCGTHINRGDRITWHSKGRVSCQSCHPWPADDNGQPTAPDTDAWASALAWNSAPPKPGASISSRGRRAPAAQPSPAAKPAAVKSPPPTPAQLDRPARLAAEARETDARGAALLADRLRAEKAAAAAEADEGSKAAAILNDWQAEDAAAPLQHRADYDASALMTRRAELPQLSPLALGVYELGTLLVNAVDRLSAGDCDALRAHLALDAETSASGGRRRIFEILARAAA